MEKEMMMQFAMEYMKAQPWVVVAILALALMASVKLFGDVLKSLVEITKTPFNLVHGVFSGLMMMVMVVFRGYKKPCEEKKACVAEVVDLDI